VSREDTILAVKHKVMEKGGFDPAAKIYAHLVDTPFSHGIGIMLSGRGARMLSDSVTIGSLTGGHNELKLLMLSKKVTHVDESGKTNNILNFDQLFNR
jgi:hypothetical protein